MCDSRSQGPSQSSIKVLKIVFFVLTLDHNVEKTLGEAVQYTDRGSFMPIDPNMAQKNRERSYPKAGGFFQNATNNRLSCVQRRFDLISKSLQIALSLIWLCCHMMKLSTILA